MTDKSPLVIRAQELLAEINDLSDEMDKETHHFKQFKITQDLLKKRKELQMLRDLLIPKEAKIV